MEERQLNYMHGFSFYIAVSQQEHPQILLGSKPQLLRQTTRRVQKTALTF